MTRLVNLPATKAVAALARPIIRKSKRTPAELARDIAAGRFGNLSSGEFSRLSALLRTHIMLSEIDNALRMEADQ